MQVVYDQPAVRGRFMKRLVGQNWSIWCLLSILLTFSPLQAGEDEVLENSQLALPENVTFVSLGSCCKPAKHLRACGLRVAAYPFDWMLSIDGMKLVELLDDNFAFFMDESYLLPHPTSGILLHHRYHLEFSHEQNSFGAPYFKNMAQLKDKYNRRVERFRQLRNYQGKVYFIRKSFALSTHPNYVFHDKGNLQIGVEYATQLFDALKRFFPQLDFDLVIINENQGQPHLATTAMFDHIRIFSGDESEATDREIFTLLIHDASR